MTGALAQSPYGAPLGQPAGGSGGGGGAATLAALYAAGTSGEGSNFTLDATRGGFVFDGTAVSGVDPVTVINGKAGSGYVAQVAGTARTGYTLKNASATVKGAFGYAVSAGDWITATGAGDAVIACDPTKMVSIGGLGGATPIVKIDAATGRVSLIRFDNAAVNTSSLLVSSGGALIINGHNGYFCQSGGTLAHTIDGTTRNSIFGATGSDANNAKVAIEKGSVVSTSGIQRSLYMSASFAPTSGTAGYRGTEIAYTVNQTGGANGAVFGLLVNATETAVVGTHLLLDLQAGAAGGTSKFAVDNSGKVIFGLGATALGAGAAATLGTIGGAGPATAAQNAWLKVKVGANDCYLPIWQ